MYAVVLCCIVLCFGVKGLHTLQGCHNERNGVSNHRHNGCLFNRLFRRRSKKTSTLSVAGLCEGNPPVDNSKNIHIRMHAVFVSAAAFIFDSWTDVLKTVWNICLYVYICIIMYILYICNRYNAILTWHFFISGCKNTKFNQYLPVVWLRSKCQTRRFVMFGVKSNHGSKCCDARVVVPDTVICS